ncbi:MAG TPA: homoserine dehydrogenase [Nitrospiria bacterium]
MSPKKQKIGVGLIGFGTVGTGVVRILTDRAGEIFRRLGVPLELVRIADLDIKRDRGIALPPGVLTDRAESLIDDPAVDIVVELIGGYDPARRFILRAMEKGKSVVTANKALLAVHGEELYAAAQTAGVDLGFEASVGGGIPIIRAMKEGLAANRILSIYGIINGTANYILSKMTEERRPFAEVLAEAQKRGYAEADPRFDIEGIDSAHKLAILVTLAFGTPVEMKSIYTEGITGITPTDIEYAKEFGYRIKLLAIAKAGEDGQAIEVRVHPTMIPEDYLIATVNGVYNAIYISGDAVGNTLFYGQGAGSMPTGSAVVSDLMEAARNILYDSVGCVPPTGFDPGSRPALAIKPMEAIRSNYFIRFSALDKPGVLSRISGVLGKFNISISSMIQKGRKADEAVPVVMMTHRALERDVQQALAEIGRMSDVTGKTVLIRVEGEDE